MLVMAVAAAVIVLVLLFQRNVDSLTIQGGAFNYFGERRMEYTGDCRLQYTEDRVTLTDDAGEHVLDNTPLYTAEGDVIVPRSYIWNDISDGFVRRLEHFGRLEKENGAIYMRDGDRERENPRGFLHDGVDTYIFLESVEIKSGDQTAVLPALSYAVSRYGNTLQLYSSGSGESVVWYTEEDQTASFGNGDVLNMGTDTLYLANGTWRLLIVNPGLLERMD